MNAVFNSALPAWLRPYALAMADFAAHDGSRVFPSVELLCRRTGRSRRAVQAALGELRNRGVLRPVGRMTGGRGKATRYQFVVTVLPTRGNSDRDERATSAAPFNQDRFHFQSRETAQSWQERVQPTPETAQPAAPDPLDPSEIHQITKRPRARRAIGGKGAEVLRGHRSSMPTTLPKQAGGLGSLPNRALLALARQSFRRL